MESILPRGAGLGGSLEGSSHSVPLSRLVGVGSRGTNVSGRVCARKRLQVLEWRASDKMRREAGTEAHRPKFCSNRHVMARKWEEL